MTGVATHGTHATACTQDTWKDWSREINRCKTSLRHGRHCRVPARIDYRSLIAGHATTTTVIEDQYNKDKTTGRCILSPGKPSILHRCCKGNAERAGTAEETEEEQNAADSQLGRHRTGSPAPSGFLQRRCGAVRSLSSGDCWNSGASVAANDQPPREDSQEL